MEEREEEERKIVDVMCCDVVADRRSHGGPATRRGAECCIIARIRAAAVGGRVAGVLMRVRMWGALAEKTRRGSSPERGSSPGIVMMMMM